MKTIIVAYLVAGLAFLVVDAIWLTIMTQTFYRPLLGDRLVEGFVFAPAMVFYLIYVAAIVYFAVLPAIEDGSLVRAATNGAILGLAAYATYDLTNQATMKDWPLAITLADIPWGMFVSAVGASAGFLAASRFG
jgi:uncharacterized membrane protein